MDVLGFAERIWREVVRRHYHIPRAVYLLVYLIGAGSAGVLLQLDSAWLLRATGFVSLLGLQGLIRWGYESHPPAVVAVPLFAAATPGDAAEVQRLILTALRDHSSGRLRFVRVRETVGPEDLPLASRLRVRLRSLLLLYGEVRNLDGKVSVRARLLSPTRAGVTHVDTFTEDVTPQRTSWRSRLYQRLTPANDPDRTEYPFEFTTEVDTIVRSLEGTFLLQLGQPKEAERLLRSVLGPVRNSTSHAVDEVRLDLVEALEEQGREGEALTLLRERAVQPTASPEVLRTLAAKLRFPAPSAQALAEAVSLLRRAAEQRTDPKRDMTLYNLAHALEQIGEVGEAYRLIDELLRSDSHYRKAWYVKRLKGIEHWERAHRLRAEKRYTEARAEFRAAAWWYTAAIRARPRFDWARVASVRVPLTGRFVQVPFRLYYSPVPPTMWANLADAWREADASRRARIYGWLEKRGRIRAATRGRRAMYRHEWGTAVRHFGQSVTGRRDEAEAVAQVSCAVAEHALGHHNQEAGRFEQAQELVPHAAALFDRIRQEVGV
jgi:tetratricopeptide (TPR) repeat protein